jgi:hypothetical protein
VTRPTTITDRAYWLGIARVHHIYGNRDARNWAIDRARRAPVRPDFTAARLAWMDEDAMGRAA